MTGESISHYRVLERIGSGAMGVVYRAEDTRLGRLVAIKFLTDGEANADHARLERFRREARTASVLNHPHICVIHDVDEHQGRPFLVMELLEGETLAQRLSAGAASADEVVRWAMQVADALHAAHQKGIVHRDIKPANIFITSRGEAKVLDFGLAKFALGAGGDADPTIMRTAPTQQGQAVGTVAYMAPEQVRAEELDGRADIFALGVVIYEMATGRRPFGGATSGMVFDAILNRPPEGTVPIPELDRVIRKALEKDRSLRYQTAEDLLVDLKRLRRDTTTASSDAVGDRRAGARGGLPMVAAVVVAVIAAIAATAYWFRPREVATPPADLKPVRLTANPSDFPVTGAALSPDGRFLAYSDPRGIHLRVMASSETESIPNTDGIIVSGWSSDGTKVIGLRQASGEGLSTWSVSIVGAGSRRPIQGLPAPDGRHTLVIGESQLWIEGPAGRRQLNALQLPPAASDRPVWTADSRRILALRPVPAAGPGASELLALDVATDRVETLASADVMPGHIRGMTLAGVDRLIFSVAEIARTDRYASQSEQNLWDYRIGASAPARRLTNWAGFEFRSLSATPDGLRLSFLQTKYQDDVWVGRLEAQNTRLIDPRRVTLDDRTDRPLSWTADSRAVMFISNRNGTMDAFVQEVERDAPPQIIAGGPGGQTLPRATADGQWVLFADLAAPSRVFRVAQAGGAAELVATVLNLTSLRCGLARSSPCVVEHRDGDAGTVVRLIDPQRGPGPVLFRKGALTGTAAQSPTVDRFAYVLPPAPNQPRNTIRVVWRDGTVDRELLVRGATSLTSLDYAADGNGFFASDYSTDLGARLLHVAVDGTVSVLWSNRAATGTWGVPSPDGRWLAFIGATQESNVWVLEKF